MTVSPTARTAANPDYIRAQYERVLHAPRILIDFESRSILPLTGKESVGAERYSEHPSTRILWMSYKIGKALSKLWFPFGGEPFPYEVLEAVEDEYVFEAHNAAFERAMWRNQITRLYGVPLPETWVDTMATCAYRSIPMKLDAVNSVLRLEQQKDPRGTYLIRALCSPKKLTKADKKAGLPVIPEMPTHRWNEDPGLMQEFGRYCAQDTEAEAALGDAIRDLPPSEYAVWRLDQEINERGVYIDIEAVRAANNIRLAVEEKLEAELEILTGGAVKTGGELDKMAAWAATQGIHMPDMTADTIDLYLNPKRATPLPAPVKRLLEIRQVLSRASAKKLVKFITMLCKDGRIRGLLQYHGAGTGRWAGRGVQPQNFPRPEEWYLSVVQVWSEKKKKMVADPQASMELLFSTILTGDDGMLMSMYGDPMAALASALRGFIIAAPDHELYVADFSAIEARVLAWVAGEQWKLDAFAGIDRGEGYKGSKDIYLATASSVFGYPCIDKETHHAERQVGKTCVGADTRVLTKRGFIPILCVRKDDQVWDGEEWVRHEGILDQGEKETVLLAGVRITPDHDVLVHRKGIKGGTWIRASEGVSSGYVLSLMLEVGSANLPSSGLSFYRPEGSRQFGFNALAAHHLTRSGCTISSKAEARDATPARKNKPAIGAKTSGATPTSFLIAGIDGGFSTVSLLASNAATTRMLAGMPITVAVESLSSLDGEKTVELSSLISSRSKDGTTRRSNSTAKTRIKAISPATFASSHGLSTPRTSERSVIFNDGSLRWKNVYDLANAGPRRRFTILTDAGPVIIHNCELAFGYQGGVGAWRKFDDSDKWSDAEVDEKKKAWRASHPMTETFWYQIEDTAIQAILTRRACSYRGVTYQVVESKVGDWLACRLPNGRCLWYYHPRLEKVPSKYGKFNNGVREPFKYEIHYEGKNSKRNGVWDDIKTYGGMLTENIVQAISRDLMCEAMFRVSAAGYPIVLTVHDEIISERRKNTGGNGKEFNALMSVVPDWTPGLPIAVAGYIAERYRKD